MSQDNSCIQKSLKHLVERGCDYLQDLEAPFTDDESEELCRLLRSTLSYPNKLQCDGRWQDCNLEPCRTKKRCGCE